MTETTDHAWTIVVRIEDTDRWIDWSTGHRTVPEVLAAAELIVPVSTIAEIRFDRITTVRKRFSLTELAAPASGPGGAAGETQPPTVSWYFDGEYETGKWHGIGNTYLSDQHEKALAYLQHRTRTDKGHSRIRMVRATTTYTIEAVQPAAVSQPETEA